MLLLCVRKPLYRQVLHKFVDTRVLCVGQFAAIDTTNPCQTQILILGLNDDFMIQI